MILLPIDAEGQQVFHLHYVDQAEAFVFFLRASSCLLIDKTTLRSDSAKGLFYRSTVTRTRGHQLTREW